MQRVAGVIVAAVLLSTNPGRQLAVRSAEIFGSSSGSTEQSDDRMPLDVAALISQARGAPPMICALASQAIRNLGWNDWSDAPSTPLTAVMPERRDTGRDELSTAEINQLLEALSTNDACVRELSVSRMMYLQGYPLIWEQTEEDEVYWGTTCVLFL